MNSYKCTKYFSKFNNYVNNVFDLILQKKKICPFSNGITYFLKSRPLLWNRYVARSWILATNADHRQRDISQLLRTCGGWKVLRCG